MLAMVTVWVVLEVLVTRTGVGEGDGGGGDGEVGVGGLAPLAEGCGRVGR